jgi:hypothetical protein
MWNEPTFDCQQCGACCVNQGFLGGTAYVYLTRDEAKRMRRIGLTVVQVDGDAHLGTRVNARRNGTPICVAFQGDVGSACGCGIYAERPRPCRAFLVGGRECLAARRRAGLAG